MLLHDLTPQVSPAPPPRPWFPQRSPGTLGLLLPQLAAIRCCRRCSCARRWRGKLADNASAAFTFASDLLLRPEQLVTTRFNSVVSAHRVFDTRRFLVEEFDAIRRLVDGATVNDAVLAVCGGALRSHLQSLGELPEASLSASHAGADAAARRRRAARRR